MELSYELEIRTFGQTRQQQGGGGGGAHVKVFIV